MRVRKAGVALALLAALTACGSTSPMARSRVMSELGIFEPGVPESYTPVGDFTAMSGVRPNLAVYYSGWYEPFRATFATEAARHGAVTLVQIDPTGISLAAIAAGTYDTYLRTYARAVRTYGDKVILSFGHEMNASWYSWGFTHTPRRRSWRRGGDCHRVPRGGGQERNLAVDGKRHGVQACCPYRSVVARRQLRDLAGYRWLLLRDVPDVRDPVRPDHHRRARTQRAPVLIAETGATPAAGKPVKIASVFAGVHAYGLLGFVWFDADTNQDWRISDDPAAVAALRRDEAAYTKRQPS